MKRCLIIQERHNTARFTQTWRCAQLKEEGLHVHVAMASHLHNSQGNKYTANLASNPVFGCKKNSMELVLGYFYSILRGRNGMAGVRTS